MDSKESFTTGSKEIIMKPHPLLNRLVIVRTFSNLDVDNLKKCRGVCKMWNKIALGLLPEKTEFDCRKMSPKDIDGALEALAKDLCLIPQNFVYSFNSNYQLTCRKFMKYYGHRIVSLRLRPWESTDIFSREDLVSLLFQCPYLTSISLSAIPEELASGSFLFPRPLTGDRNIVFPNMTSLTLYGGTAYSVEFLCDIFTAMPNLSTFIVHQAHVKFLDQIFWLLKNPNYTLPDLKIFKIIRPLEFNNDHLIRIELCGFHLKVLNLSRVQKANNSIGKIYLEPLLQTLAFTLEELTLPAFRAARNDGEIRGYGYRCQVSFPKMLSLRKLELEDWKLFGPLTYVKTSFPKLKFLSVDDPNECGEDEVQLAIPDRLTPHMKLNELALPFSFYDETSLEGILKGFPQLKKLKLFVTNAILLVIYNFGKQLEELHMYSTSLGTDTGITGIPKKHCDFLRKDHFRAVRKAENNAWTKTKDSIETLPKLKRLTLASAGKMFITDVSILYGVKQLKNLTNLCLRNCMISDQSLVELINLPLLQLDLGSLGDCKTTQIGLCYFKQNMPFTHLLFTEKSCPNF